METQKQEISIQWYLNFINVDLSQLSMGGRMKLIGDAITIIDEKTPAPFKKDGTAVLPYKESIEDDKSLVDVDSWGERIGIWLKENKLETCQDALRSCFLEMIQIFNDAKEQIKEIGVVFFRQRNSLPLYQKKLKNVYIKVELPINEPTLMMEEVLPDQIKKKNVKTSSYDIETQIYLEEFEKASPYVSYITETEEITLLNYFLMEIRYVSLGFFKKCAECGNWFIHMTKRKKIFCSSQCAMRKANRDRRKHVKEHDPDEYEKENIAGRKRAKKSYSKKKKK